MNRMIAKCKKIFSSVALIDKSMRIAIKKKKNCCGPKSVRNQISLRDPTLSIYRKLSSEGKKVFLKNIGAGRLYILKVKLSLKRLD